jgi:aspartyl-tRNA(Asn)/glutamyl-tRNA(Gln) amidotransferase subunit B
LLDLMDAGTISGKQAKDVLEKAFAGGASPKAVVESEGISQLSDTSELESIVDAIIAENPKAVEDFRSGKASAVQFLMGQVMKRTKGRARPDVVTPLLQSKLSQA